MKSHAWKIILTGGPEVGKSKLFDRFSKGDCGENYIATKNAEYCKKKYIHMKKNIACN